MAPPLFVLVLLLVIVIESWFGEIDHEQEHEHDYEGGAAMLSPTNFSAY